MGGNRETGERDDSRWSTENRNAPDSTYRVTVSAGAIFVVALSRGVSLCDLVQRRKWCRRCRLKRATQHGQGARSSVTSAQ
jgi:hypothetical protein